MKKLMYVFMSLSVLLAACGPTVPATTPAPTETPVTSAIPQLSTETPTPQPIQTSPYPPEGYGPANFPSNIDPLTGVQVADPALLERRPMLIKVSNLPRNVRPQWGLSLADIVYEYYTEEGSTRFAAIFYGNNSDIVGTIRSGRFFDTHLVRGYKAIFAFGSAYTAEMDQFLSSEFANRLVVQGPNSPIHHFDPNNSDFVVVNTAELSAYITKRGVENGRQKLDGMSFKLDAPAGGQPMEQVIVRFSGSIYNRWDYDPATGRYLRFSDTVDDFNIQNEQYKQLTDRLNGQPIAADNVAVLYVPYEIYSTDSKGSNIYNIQFTGSGDGYAFRNGQVYQVKWQRNEYDVVSLTTADGTPFPFKPGITWFEVVGTYSTVHQTGQTLRFLHMMP